MLVRKGCDEMWFSLNSRTNQRDSCHSTKWLNIMRMCMHAASKLQGPFKFVFCIKFNGISLLTPQIENLLLNFIIKQYFSKTFSWWKILFEKDVSNSNYVLSSSLTNHKMTEKRNRNYKIKCLLYAIKKTSNTLHGDKKTLEG